jgi:2-succinyl-5-enolpyruvyl-6-hydroxy-3-cyclohexene-1-carboxylate synthase
VNPLGEWTRILVDALVHAGVRSAVVSPGSRSTPLTHAVVTHPSIAHDVVVDERSAAFLALGRARVEERPVLLVCTSGTAPAHYYPAVIEASEARVPLVVLSADRPRALVGRGANQTIDQTQLYGHHARRFVDLGEPDVDPAALRAMRSTVVETVVASLFPEPGPVHVNVRLAKPLEPGPARDGAELELEAAAQAVAAERLPTLSVPRIGIDSDAVSRASEACRAATRGLIVCGPMSPKTAPRSAVFELARRTGFALAPEATSQLRFVPRPEGIGIVDELDAVLSVPRARARLRPDLVVQIGRTPTSGGYGRWLDELGSVPRVCIAEHGPNDPWGSATVSIRGHVGDVVGALVERIPAAGVPCGWADLVAASRVASAAADRVVRGGALTEARVARGVVATIPERGQLVIGNSLPIRQLDWWVAGGGSSIDVLSQRGVSGIDGLVSGAVGAAAAAGRPTALLLGDLSFLHDVGGLVTTRGLSVPLAIVVLNNDGGRIFEQLPVARAEATAPVLDRWTTPHGLSFEHAAALFGLRYARVAIQASLDAALGQALATAGCTVIEAFVPSDGARRDREALLAYIESDLEAVWN